MYAHTGNEGTRVIGHIEPALFFVVLSEGTKRNMLSHKCCTYFVGTLL